MIESDSKRPVLRETRTEPRGAVWFLSIKAAGRDGALAQVNLENSPTHDLSRIGNEKRPFRRTGALRFGSGQNSPRPSISNEWSFVFTNRLAWRFKLTHYPRAASTFRPRARRASPPRSNSC